MNSTNNIVANAIASNAGSEDVITAGAGYWVKRNADGLYTYQLGANRRLTRSGYFSAVVSAIIEEVHRLQDEIESLNDLKNGMFKKKWDRA